MQKEINDHINILLVEDDKGHAALLKKNLWRTCVEASILHFQDGEQLLMFLKGESGRIGLFVSGKYVLLLDIKMPGIDGIELLEMIKQNSTLNPIPVIMVTTTSNSHEIERCYEQGCAFYIVKPADYLRFMDTIQYLGAFLSLPSLIVPEIDTEKPYRK